MRQITNLKLQKHEDVLRAILYFTNSQNHIFLEEKNHSIIKYSLKYQEENSNSHESLSLDGEKDAFSMMEIVKTLSKINIIREDTINYKAIKNSILRITRTTYCLWKKGLINKETKIALERILVKNDLQFSYDDLFHNKELKQFYSNILEKNDFN